MSERLGVLVMAYGTPRGLEDVEAYYTDIRGGRPPTAELVEELTDRYRAIGGSSPLLEITMSQAKGIEKMVGVPAYVGQKHAAPFIADAVEEMASAGIECAVGLVLAPHYSAMSVGDYAKRVKRAAESSGWQGRLEMIKSWHLEPGYIDLLTAHVGQALLSLEEGMRDKAVVVFTAHSLPEKILQKNDPYPSQLRATAEAVAEKAGLERWEVGWQSAGRTSVPWLGPDILEILHRLAQSGATAVVVCPCGFVADHLEVLYDIDIEARQLARRLGMELIRTAMPNDDPAFIETLGSVVQRAVGKRP